MQIFAHSIRISSILIRLSLTTSLFLIPFFSTAQVSSSPFVTNTIMGTVIDSLTSEPLPGALIQLEGITTTVSTDHEGKFNLVTDQKLPATLIITYLGYQAKKEVVTSIPVTITLKAALSELDEVVVVGYGTQKKGDLTGSVVHVNAATYQNQPMTQLSDMLTGTIAGFQSNQNPSASGGGSMLIRGQNSLNASTEPLIVLDGVIYNGGISDISPSDIESIDILKDASSAAVYGARAASGVVLVTTKTGRTGRPVIHFQTTIGIAEVNNKDIRPLNPSEYTNFRRDLLLQENPNKVAYYFHNPNQLPSTVTIADWYNYNSNPSADTTKEWLNRLLFYPEETENFLTGNRENWYDRVIRKAARQNYDLSINGGTENISYYWSLGYTNNKGIVAGDGFSTIRSRLNVSTNIADFLKVGVNAQFANRDESQVPANVNQMLVSSPFGSMYDVDGSVKWLPNGYHDNPLINHLLQDKLAKTTSLFSTLYAEVDLPYGLQYRLSYQPRFSFTKNYSFLPSTTPEGSNTQGFGSREDSQLYEWAVDNILKWNKGFGSHHFDVTLLYNIEKFQDWYSFQKGEGFSPNENLSFNALQFAKNYAIVNDDNYATGDALMARLNYTLMNKYLLTASIRKDGYSAFGQANPRAVFPAVALAWKASDEDFFNTRWVEQLKLRLSWGINGNRDIGRYAALARLSQNLYSDGSQVLVGVYNNALGNPDLVWEKTEAYNIGVDIGLWKGRISGSADIYQMTTKDLLMNRQLPKITGYENVTTNLGELENRGFELTVNSNNINKNNFTWNTNFVFSFNRNKIKHLFGDYEEIELNGRVVKREISDIGNQWFIGQPVNGVWDYEINGVWQENEREEAAKYGMLPGDYKAIDVNGDYVFSALDDKQFIGTREPKYNLGLRNEFSFFKNFAASVFIRADLGHIGDVSAFKHKSSNLYDRQGMRAIPYWTAANPSNKYGSLTTSPSQFGGDYGVYFSRSFVRIQDVNVSYTFPEALSKSILVKDIRVSAAIRNLYSFDSWEDWDPESGATPMPRVFSLGVNVTL